MASDMKFVSNHCKNNIIQGPTHQRDTPPVVKEQGTKRGDCASLHIYVAKPFKLMTYKAKKVFSNYFYIFSPEI